MRPTIKIKQYQRSLKPKPQLATTKKHNKKSAIMLTFLLNAQILYQLLIILTLFSSYLIDSKIIFRSNFNTVRRSSYSTIHTLKYSTRVLIVCNNFSSP